MAAIKAKTSAIARALDEFILLIAPGAGAKRIRDRQIANAYRSLGAYEGASTGRRTSGWYTTGTDANSANRGSLRRLRDRSRDLVRNNAYATRAVAAITGNTVGWGITAKPISSSKRISKAAAESWKEWALTTECDADGRSDIYGLQRLIMMTVAMSGECLVRRRRRFSADGLTVPIQIQVLEPDFLDDMKEGALTDGGFIIQGVEFNRLGKRVAYWLFEEHPGASIIAARTNLMSKRIPAEDILHIYRCDRPGQVRGVPWGSSAMITHRDFDEMEDATLMKQKVAALLVGVVTDPDGSKTTGVGLGEQSSSDPLIETMEPGTIVRRPLGGDVQFTSPPSTADYSPYAKNQLHKIAAGWGVMYEHITGDYSQVTFISGRLGRLDFARGVHDWQWNMLIPQCCQGIWNWFTEAGAIAGKFAERPGVQWAPPPVPLADPLNEYKAAILAMRAGGVPLFDWLREQGRDPDQTMEQYAEQNKVLDSLGLVFDSDPRMTTQVGGPRQQTGTGKEGGGASQPTETATE